MGRRRRRCRLWWPTNIISQNPINSSFLFGWFIPSSAASLDIVVAFAYSESELTSLSNSLLDLQEIIQRTNKFMPTLLQDKSKFSLLGHLEAESQGNSQSVKFGNDKNKCIDLTKDQHQSEHASNQGSWRCGCPKYNGISDQGRLLALESMWIKLLCCLSENINGRVLAIPKLDHLHLDCETTSQLDLHVVFYEIPTFGGHHYSLGSHSLSNIAPSICKKPNWYYDLRQRDALIDLVTVIQAMNSANAAQKLFNGRHHSECGQRTLVVHMFCGFMWQLFAVSVASLSTLIYIILQSFHILLSWLSHVRISIILAKLFSDSLKNIHFRCCQLLYWPIFLQDQSLRYRSCVEFAEKAAFRKHLIWSNVAVDLLLGNIFGIALWFIAEPACLWVSNFAHDFTNNLLRTGCVWLMGNPAGFKLNTELAKILGIISLNAIQIWSTLWIFMGSFIVHFTKGIALCGIIFGLTSAAALVINIISLVTMHVLTLHLFFSILYSTQIQAVAALWRLFRGRKWNPLRHRLDSYDYTVEQHVVGSLLFTPILLLLPTTSAFYIFFTILYTAVSFICIIVEATISFIHSTPYAKIFLWLKRRKRFPSGMWFEVALYEHYEIGAVSDSSRSLGKLQKKANASSSNKSSILVSELHSNYLNLGDIIWPHCRYFFSAFSRSSIGSSAYGLLTGRSILYAPVPSLTLKLPWMVIPWKEYWHICRDSVYACREDPI